jgi:hypothetical protein
MAPYPVITLTYSNPRTGTRHVIVAPGVSVQSETGDIPLEAVANKAKVEFTVRERAAYDKDSLYMVLEDVTKNPAIRSKPELWKLIILTEDDIESVSELCVSESIPVAERVLKDIQKRAVFAYDGSLEPIRLR